MKTPTKTPTKTQQNVENFLPNGSPNESDWWPVEENSEDNTNVASTERKTVSPIRSKHNSRSVYSPSVEEDIDEDEDKNEDNSNNVTSKSEQQSTKVFRNCGYLTWTQSRKAWRFPENDITLGDATDSIVECYNDNQNRKQQNRAATKKAKQKTTASSSQWRQQLQKQERQKQRNEPIPENVKRDLIKCIKERRHFQLSRSVPLKDIIDAYTEVWADGEDP